ncbi:MAG: calcium-binding protein [Hyphomicrobiales bacterium]|nr:calcium-binding protein [Hyphomicrobiales bacterium]
MATVTGTDNAETLNGADGVTNGPDEIYGLGGDDFLYGNGGNDMLKGGGGADALNGGAGFDTANYTDSAEGVQVSLMTGEGTGGTAEGDTLTSIESLTGSSHGDLLIGDNGNNTLDGWDGNDTLLGYGGTDTLIGGEGNDVLKGGGGGDTLIGGEGVDTASYLDSPGGVIVNLASNAGVGSDANGDSLFGIENIIGSNHSDNLYGDAGKNDIRGNDGNDLIAGGKGKDTLRGGDDDDTIVGGKGKDKLLGQMGNDNLVGGGGKDKFVFDNPLGLAQADTIGDFKTNKDKIVLDNAIFAAVGNKVGNGEFVIGKKAKDGNDHIIYNDNNGKLFYDANGDSGGGKVLFATLDTGLNLDAQDFLVI